MKHLIATTLCSLCCGAAAAQPAYTLSQLKDSALANNAAMHTARLAADAAAEQRREAFTKYFPNVSATGLWFNANRGMAKMDVNPAEVVASSVCSLHTSTDSYNVIADYAVIKMTLRTFSDETNDFVEGLIRDIAQASASQMGGTCKVDARINYPANMNDAAVCAKMRKAHIEVVGESNAVDAELDITSEDYSYFSRLRPSCYFRLGTRNEEKGCTQELHSNDFQIDEAALSIGAKAFVQFVLDNQAG